ncbi:hypothetical protein MCOR30_001472 [Pyricularia oryzae]|nr:hypothetical protein MCOR30_001472 [Pyricularia oryzae]
MSSSYAPPSNDGGVVNLVGGGRSSAEADSSTSQPQQQQRPQQQLPGISPLHAIATSATQHQQQYQNHQRRASQSDVHPNSRQTAQSQGLPSPVTPRYESSAQSTVASAQHSLQILQAATATSTTAAGPTPLPAIQDAGISQQPREQHHYPPLAPIPHGFEQQQHPPYPATSPDSQAASGYDGLPYSPTAPSPGSAAGPSPPAGATMPTKQTRLRRACDMCSARKVKCDEAGPPCKPCSSLNVECTYRREMKRRGPPNKHAEAARAKRVRLEPNPGWNNSPETPAVAAPASASPEVSQSTAPVTGAQQANQGQMLGAESIAPWPMLELLIDDYYTYIHPLIPFPHEPSFRRAFENREDKTNPVFLGLLASMIGCLVASFPRAARLHLKSQRGADLFPRAIVMIDHCRDVALRARGHTFAVKESYTIEDASTSYLLAIASGYTMQWKACRRFMSETLTIVRELGFHLARRNPQILGAAGDNYEMGQTSPRNHIHDQMGKRIFWVVMVGVRSMVQLGASTREIPFPPPTTGESFPGFPAEVDDEYITETEIRPQPPGTVSQIAGFNAGIRIYSTMNPLVAVELSYGISSISLREQEDLLAGCIQAVKHAIDNLPPELRLNIDLSPVNDKPTGSDNNASALNFDFSKIQGTHRDLFEDAPGYQYFPPAYPNQQPANDVRHVIVNQPERRRLLQWEIQKSNIYVSLLSTLSYYVERCFTLRDAHHSRGMYANGGSDNTTDQHAANRPSTTVDGVDKPDEFAIERERIVQNLLVVLASITQRNMEPNGPSIINKIRQVASTLLADAPERKGPVAVKSEETLKHFVDILIRLEKTGGPGASSRRPPASAESLDPQIGAGVMTPMDEEEELRTWADLREFQLRFAQNGGFTGGM